MLDIKFIRENPEKVAEGAKNKNIEIRVWASHNALFHNLEKEMQFRLEEKFMKMTPHWSTEY